MYSVYPCLGVRGVSCDGGCRLQPGVQGPGPMRGGYCGHVTSLHQSQVTCTATITTSIQEEKSNGSRKAVGEMMPVLLDTRIVMPVSRKGTEKSITDSLEIMDQH